MTIGNSVIEIGNGAFANCSGLTSVTIPNSVTSIGYYAFYGCSGLTSVTIPNSVTEISDYAFRGCSGLISLTIGNSVTSIGSSAFEGCSSLTSVTVPNSVTSIGSSAFSGCNSLTSLTIGNSVTEISDYAFSGCSGLTSVTICNSVTSIGNDAFSGCSSLTSVTIPNSVTEIGYSAFSGCSGLTSVTIPNSVTKIGEYAFEDCNLCTLKMLGSTPPKTQGTIGVNTIEVPIGSTLNYASAKNWSNIETIYAKDGDIVYCPVLPSIVAQGEELVEVVGIDNEGIEVPTNTTIEVQSNNNSFLKYGLVMKGSCEITDYFNENGKYYFNPVPQYKNNTISTYSYTPTDVKVTTSGTLIDQIGIDNIEKISCLKLSGNINGTDILTIRKMKNLKLLDLSDAHIVNGGMSFFDNYTTSENTIGEHFYDGLKKLLRIKLPLDIHTIKRGAFSGCDSVLTIFIPQTVKEYCTDLTVPLSRLCSIQIEDLSAWCNMTTKHYTAQYHSFHFFIKDKEIVDLVIPDDIKTIKRYTFKGLAWIKTVTIPSVVTSLEEGAFLGCNNIISVTSLNPTPPEITKEIFEEKAYANSTLYVPKGSKTLYWLHPYWENFKNIVEIETSSDETIGDVNGDNKVNGTDIQAVINVIVDEEYTEEADINKDNKVNGTDIQEIINIIVEEE